MRVGCGRPLFLNASSAFRVLRPIACRRSHPERSPRDRASPGAAARPAPPAGAARGRRLLRRRGDGQHQHRATETIITRPRLLGDRATLAGDRIGLRPRDGHLEQPKRTIGIVFAHQRHRHVEDRNVRTRASFRLTVVGVAVEDRGYRETRDGILEPAAAEEGKDVARLALDRRLDRRVVEERDRCARCAAARAPIPASALRRRASRTNRLMISSPHGPSARRPKPPAKPFHAGEADAADLDGVAIEHGDGPRPRGPSAISSCWSDS